MIATVYIVERGYDYEGADTLYGSTSREDALAFADCVDMGDRVTVTAFAPHAVEILKRPGWIDPPRSLTYERRILAGGVFIDQESEVREVAP